MMADQARTQADVRPVSDPARFATLALIFVLVVGLAVLVWRIGNVFVLVFGAVLLAIVLRAAAQAVQRVTKLSAGWSFAAALLVIVLVLTGIFYLVGTQIAGQIGQLAEDLPKAWSSVRSWLEQRQWGRALTEYLQSVSGGVGASRIAGFLGTSFGGLGDALLILVLAVFLGANPGLYRRGFLCLIPPRHESRVADALDSAGSALRKWLMGQAIVMAAVAVVTGVGLWLLGVPLALTLGLLAGLFNFVPYIGPIVMAIPAILLAFTVSPTLALYTAIFYVVVQQLEGNAMQPLIQKWAVALPPALALIAVVVFGLLFGILGVIFATPMMVVLMVMVRKLYVEGAHGRT